MILTHLHQPIEARYRMFNTTNDNTVLSNVVVDTAFAPVYQQVKQVTLEKEGSTHLCMSVFFIFLSLNTLADLNTFIAEKALFTASPAWCLCLDMLDSCSLHCVIISSSADFIV